MIFEYLAGDLPSIAAVARVCGRWKEPALDELWKELPGLQPILRALRIMTLDLNPYDKTREVCSTSKVERGLTRIL